MPGELYDTIRSAIDIVAEAGFDGEPRDLERFRSRVITRLLTLVETVDSADADYLLDKLTDLLLHAPADETQSGRALSDEHVLVD
jgi:hypothetical protein